MKLIHLFRSYTPHIIVDREVEKHYSPAKIEEARRKARLLIEEFPRDPKLFRRFIKKELGYTVGKSVSFGLNINGHSKMLSLVVIPLNHKLVFKIRALDNPTFISPDF